MQDQRDCGQRCLDEQWSDWLGGLHISHDGPGQFVAHWSDP